jgi:hypothetical protein
MSDAQLFSVGIILLALACDTVFLAWFLRPYFRHGLLVYRRSFKSSGPLPAFASLPCLQDVAHSTVAPPFRVRLFDASALGFRESLFHFRLFNYTPLMHGLIELNPPTGTITVSGRLNLSPPVFAAWAAVFFGGRGDWSGVAFLAVLLGLLYSIQYYRFSAFGKRVLAVSLPASQTGTCGLGQDALNP